MPAGFVETMRGELYDAAGTPRSASVELAVCAPSWGQLLRDGRTTLRGVIRAAPWVDAAPIRGTLTIHPRLLTYSVEVDTDFAPGYVLTGQKRPRLLSLLATMTRMPVTLIEPTGEPAANGWLRFDLRDLPPFVASALPGNDAPRRALDDRRRAVERQWLIAAGA